MKINQVESLTQIPKKSIRYYEDEGLLHPQREAGNGYRNYSEEDVALLKRIKLLRKLGLPVEEIRRVFLGSLTLSEALERQKIALAHQKNDWETKQRLCDQLLSALDEDGQADVDAFLDGMGELERGGMRFVNIEKVDRKRDLQGVWLSCVGFALFMLAFGALICWGNSTDPLPLWIFIFMEALIVAPALGVFAAGLTRIREIKGGEEDDLSQY